MARHSLEVSRARGFLSPWAPHPHPPQKGVRGGKTEAGKGECIWGVAGRVMPKVVP